MIKRITTIIFLLSIGIILFNLQPKAFGKNDTTLRVCVLKDAKGLTLTIKGNYSIYKLKTNEFISTGRNLRKAEVLPTSSGLTISKKPFRIYGIKIMPQNGSLVYINKRAFRGNVDIIRTETKRLLVINHIDVEDYLKGVLYHEVSHWWPIETLKAQAIAARTYALYQRSKRGDKDFDLTNDIYSQVYGGRTSERIRTNRAVDLTKGRVLTFKNKIFPAYYHATCGGYTENASNLWDIDLAPLKGRKCDFCRHSPHYKWKYKVSIRSVEKKLKHAGYNTGTLKDIKPHGKTSSGRVKQLKLISDKELIIPAKDFRLIIGPNFIRSTNFKVKKDRKHFLFYGQGWGHGVGMCQWGAFFLGLKRYKAKNILRYYYPGAKITKI